MKLVQKNPSLMIAIRHHSASLVMASCQSVIMGHIFVSHPHTHDGSLYYCSLPDFFPQNYLKCQHIYYDYSKCSKMSNIFLFLLSNIIFVLKAGIHKMLIRTATGKTLIRLLLIWVCAVCAFFAGTRFPNFRTFTLYVTMIKISSSNIQYQVTYSY